MPRTLPINANIDQLRNQAKDLVKAHKNGDSNACNTLRTLRQFSRATDPEILASNVTLTDAQYALALDYGFPSWNSLKGHIAGNATGGALVKRENDRVWIDGVPELTWPRSGGCTFAGALSGALSVTKHPSTYNQIMGYSGLAFRVRWYRREDTPGWCPSSPVGEFPDEISAFELATGWRFRHRSMMETSEEDPHMERFGGDIVQSIDRGFPVVGYPQRLDVGVCFGYEKEKAEMFLLWRDYWTPGQLRNPVGATGPWFMFIEDREPAMDARDAFLTSLSGHTWRRGSMPANKPAQGIRASYLYGDAALSTWSDDIARSEEWDDGQRKSLFFVSWWCFSTLEDARRAAAAYLNEGAVLLEGEARSAVQRAATIYGNEAATLQRCYETKDAFLGPWSGKSVEDWTPDVRSRECDILGYVRAQETIAIAELDLALREAVSSTLTTQ